MSAELELVEPELNELERAEKLVTDARVERMQRCSEAINKVLEDHRCQITVEVVIGQQVVPAAQILNLPVRASITSK